MAQPSLFEVENAGFKVKGKNGTKHLLQDISLKVRGGEVLALIGPSGSGKTILLELMSLALKNGSPSGIIKLNGQQLTLSLFHQHAAFVEQYSSHWPFLTCREIMDYSAALYIPGSKTKRDGRVHEGMESLGLLECAGTRAGNDFFKGISGGQKKRLSLAIGLLKSPSLMFLDEPTSGLDASGTVEVITHLKETAKATGAMVIATIHQPSTEVFMSFTDAMFLANGRVAYYGHPGKLADHCVSVRRSVPRGKNPADHFLNLINSEFVGRAQVDKFVGIWEKRGNRRRSSMTSAGLQPLPPVSKPGILSKCTTLLQRHAVLSLRNVTLYLSRMVCFFISNCFFAVIYIKSRDYEQKNAVPRFFQLCWFLAIPAMLSVAAVFSVNEDFKLLRKEIKNGMSSAGAYVLATTLLQVPYIVLLAISSLAIPEYLIADYPTSAAFQGLAVMSVMIWSYECIGEFLAILADNAMVGMFTSLGVWFCSFLFSGIFLKAEFVIWPFRAFCSALPLGWAIRSMGYLGYHETDWEGAELAPNSTMGFVCPGAKRMGCFGRTGDDVLRSLSVNFPVEAEDTVLDDIALMALMGAVWKLLFIIRITMRSRSSGTLKVPEKSRANADADNGRDEFETAFV